MPDTTEKAPAKRKRTSGKSGKRKRRSNRQRRVIAFGLSQREERALYAMWARSPVVRLLANAYVDGLAVGAQAAASGNAASPVSIDDVVKYAAQTWRDHVRAVRRSR